MGGTWYHKYSMQQIDDALAWVLEQMDGGTSASLLHQTSLRITDDQIKTLPTAAVDLTAAPGINRLVIPSRAVVVTDFASAAYIAAAGASWEIDLGDPATSGLMMLGVALMQGPLQSTDSWYVQLPQGDGVGTGDFLGLILGSGAPVAGLVNQALQLRDFYDGVSNYTGGDPNNTALVNVQFTVLDVTLDRLLTTAESGWDPNTRSF